MATISITSNAIERRVRRSEADPPGSQMANLKYVICNSSQSEDGDNNADVNALTAGVRD